MYQQLGLGMREGGRETGREGQAWEWKGEEGKGEGRKGRKGGGVFSGL